MQEPHLHPLPWSDLWKELIGRIRMDFRKYKGILIGKWYNISINNILWITLKK